MKTSRMQMFATVTVISLGFVVSLSAQAQNTAETLYKSKCAGCHGADADAELSTIITNGKNKMPAYGKSLKTEDIQGLVAYIRTLRK
jgi:mono/diheme cytochrome c family protein